MPNRTAKIQGVQLSQSVGYRIWAKKIEWCLGSEVKRRPDRTSPTCDHVIRMSEFGFLGPLHIPSAPSLQDEDQLAK